MRWSDHKSTLRSYGASPHPLPTTQCKHTLWVGGRKGVRAGANFIGSKNALTIEFGADLLGVGIAMAIGKARWQDLVDLGHGPGLKR